MLRDSFKLVCLALWMASSSLLTAFDHEVRVCDSSDFVINIHLIKLNWASDDIKRNEENIVWASTSKRVSRQNSFHGNLRTLNCYEPCSFMRQLKMILRWISIKLNWDSFQFRLTQESEQFYFRQVKSFRKLTFDCRSFKSSGTTPWRKRLYKK